VVLVPVPVVDTVPGYRINVQVPDEGNPDNKTLPVDSVHEGAVIVSTMGAGGISGCGFIRTFPDGEDIHPVELVTVKVYVPDGIVETVVVLPEPETVTPPGVLVNVQLPVDGRPLKATLPVDNAHVGCVIAPTTGGVGEDGCAVMTISADGRDIHP
jgi:hypothetical protein